MEENKEILELMRKIEASNRRRMVVSVLTCAAMVVAAAGCMVLCVNILNLMPQVSSILSQLENLQLEELVQSVDSLAQYAQGSLELTMDKLNAIDFETLNKAIGDLAKVIEPLAEFAQIFK